MMNNKKMSISNIPGFIRESQRLGCYTENQRTNFESTWSVLTKVLAAEGLSLDSTIDQVQPKVDSLFDHHGGNSPASAESIRVYKARIKRLLTDFIEHNAGDFMAWKKTLEKSPTNGDTKPRKVRKTPKRSVKSSGSEGAMDTITHQLFAGDGKEGKISIPRDLTEDQIERVWVQLDAIKTLVKAQSGVIEPKSK
jgi:hypothetical protein